jgi:hypothetical protein
VRAITNEYLEMTRPAIPTIDDYEPLIGAESVERICRKAEGVQMAASG